MLTIRLLGELQVLASGQQTLTLPPSKKTRALLAYLAVAGRPQRRERLCDLFWDVPDDPRGALRWSLTHPIPSSWVAEAAGAPDAVPRCVLSSRCQNMSVGRWGWRNWAGSGAHRPGRHGPVGWNQRAMPANNSASGCEAAKAMRTRAAVSMTRAATLISRSRSVVNSARASGCGLGMASRMASSSQ